MNHFIFYIYFLLPDKQTLKCPYLMNTEVQSPQNDLYEISLEVAIDWTNRWRQFQSENKPNPDDSKKAFRVDVAELQEVVNNIPGKVKYVRFYMGLDDKAIEHLLMVGVDEENKDLYAYDGKAYTYDFSHPCPSTCDIDSPLYGDQ